MESPCSLPKFKKWVNKAACVVKNWPHTCTGQLFTSGIFMCAETSSITERSYETQSGNEATQSFASQIQPTPERIAFSIKVIRAWLAGFRLLSYFGCMFLQFIWPTFTLFGPHAVCSDSFPAIQEVVQLSCHLTNFQTVQPDL